MRRIVRRMLCLLLCLLLAGAAGGCALLPQSEPEFVGDTAEIPEGSPYKHYFKRLSDTQKMAYNALLSEIYAFPQRVEIPLLTRDELSEMYTALLYDNPELFFLSGESVMRQVNKRTYLYPEYRMDAADYEAMSGKCGKIAAQILDDARKKESVFDRERVIHDHLIAMCSYSDDEADLYRSTIYGALCGAEAACEGYAKTAKYLLDALGVPCFVVIGNSTPPGSRTQSHMWNVVQLDGAWYHLDLTWDDPVLEKGGDLIRYFFFNVTDETVGKTHKDYDTGVACTATKDNFFVHEKLLFASFGEEECKRAASFGAQVLDAGSDGFQLRFADQKAYESAQKALFDDGLIYTLLKQTEKKSEQSFATDQVTYFTTDEDYTIEILPVR